MGVDHLIAALEYSESAGLAETDKVENGTHKLQADAQANL